MLSEDRAAISTSILGNGGERKSAAPEVSTEERRRKERRGEERGRQREQMHSSGN